MNPSPKPRVVDKIRPVHCWVLFCALVLTTVGCAPRLLRITERIRTGEKDSYYLADVPFVRQERYWCGPAALSSVLTFWGKEVSQKEIAREIYRPAIRGTLTFELENYARKAGLWAKAYRGNLADLEDKLSSGFPLIVLLKPYPFLRRYHYLVVVGYSRPEQVVIVHTGKKPDALLSVRKFLRTWEGGDCWALLICPPDKVGWELPAEDRNQLGVVQERRGELEKAAANYSQALALEPDNPEYYFHLGNARRKQGRLEEAESSYRRAIALRPDYADAYNNLAVIYLEDASRREEAEEYVQKAITLHPEGGRYYWDTLGEIYLRQHKLQEAENAFSRALKLTPSDESQTLAIIYRHLGEVYQLQGRIPEARRNFQKAETLIDGEKEK